MAQDGRGLRRGCEKWKHKPHCREGRSLLFTWWRGWGEVGDKDLSEGDTLLSAMRVVYPHSQLKPSLGEGQCGTARLSCPEDLHGGQKGRQQAAQGHCAVSPQYRPALGSRTLAFRPGLEFLLAP